METKKKTTGKILAGVLALVALVAILVVVFVKFGAKPVAGSKTISIEVVDSAEQSTVYDLKTDAEFLQQAMDEAEGLTYGGQESEYGMMVETVNDEFASYTETGAYWAFYVNGEYCNYGIETQPIADGDNFSIVYTKAE